MAMAGGWMRAPMTALCVLCAAVPAAKAQVKPAYVEKTYAISGETGRALYDSIGVHGPRIRQGASSAIAKTDFDLKWGRDYVRDGDACVLAAVRPFLTVTYTLPKPSGRLSPALASRWDTFIAGIRAHEAVHGALILAMANEIHAATLGFRQENDPGCTAIRQAIQAPLKSAFETYREKNRAFEQAEMAEGGPIQRLIIGLIE